MKQALLALAFTLVLAAAVPAGEPEGPILVTGDLVLEKGAVLRRGLRIAASHITIDGNGAVLEGPGKPPDPESFKGLGVQAEGVSGVTLRNVVARGFESGLVARDGEGWLIEGCDFSGNFHDPEHGWGEGKPAGGMVLTRISRSVIRRSKANRVWNALSLTDCHEDLIQENDLSHASNVCLKLWTSSRNQVLANDLSYGIRIKPGEVHARDSTSVLIESGSDGNAFHRNDITHGGDGVFIRALNGWVSTGNLFVENDCSYANNNCVESWCPGNTYIRNRANHGSYGFWLGGSDRTRLIGNEAGWNGNPDGPHNAAEGGFGHGGIVFVGGAGSHVLIEGNFVHHTSGAGIAFRGDVATKGKAWRTHHWVVQKNRIEDNRFGIWGRWGDWIHLGPNAVARNAEGDFLEDVAGLTVVKGDPEGVRRPILRAQAPQVAIAGRPALFDASASRDPQGLPLAFRWVIGDRDFDAPRLEHTFTRPGFYRVGVTASNGILADLDSRDLIVVEEVAEEIGTEGQAARWGFEMDGNEDRRGKVLFADDADALAGRSSLRFTPDPYKGQYATAVFPASRDAGWDLSGKSVLRFWWKARNDNIPGFQEPGPVVRLHGKDGVIKVQPSGGRNLLVGVSFNEARWTWSPVEVPLKGDKDWTVQAVGSVSLGKIEALSISLDSWGGDPFTIWLDGLCFH